MNMNTDEVTIIESNKGLICGFSDIGKTIINFDFHEITSLRTNLDEKGQNPKIIFYTNTKTKTRRFGLQECNSQKIFVLLYSDKEILLKDYSLLKNIVMNHDLIKIKEK